MPPIHASIFGQVMVAKIKGRHKRDFSLEERDNENHMKLIAIRAQVFLTMSHETA